MNYETTPVILNEVKNLFETLRYAQSDNVSFFFTLMQTSKNSFYLTLNINGSFNVCKQKIYCSTKIEFDACI